MSGGVDSSVTAALLKRAGFNVEGVFLKLYDCPQFRESEKKAKKITKILGISFLSWDLRKEFKKKVVDYFLSEYQKGRTPNPCVKCNKDIKFGIFLKKAINSGAGLIATGHYARKKGKKLFAAKDKEKDQSYFLYNLTRKQLEKILFPVGNYTKTEVKKLAKDFGRHPLTIFNLVRPESKDICFLKGKHQDFLRKHLKLKPGPILNTDGKKIGQHQGLPLYTIGQRQEIRVPAGLPYYVWKLDFKRNSLIVTDNEKDLYKKELIAEKVNWISGREPKLPFKIKAKIRYLHPAASATLVKKLQARKYKLIFSKVQRAITPGQSVVFYRGEKVLGGGIIR